MRDAITHLESGDWEAAHVIVQEDPSLEGSWAHGIVHLMEGDRSNAGYWYRRAGRPLPPDSAIASEIAALKAVIG
jgi:hypothetical protein